MIYLDSSAAVKLAHTETHSEALAAWLGERSEQMVSSVLLEVELTRALRRYDPAALGAIPSVLIKFDRVELTAKIRATAAAYDESSLRSLDAIHLATARYLATSGRVPIFVAYDARLLVIARNNGFEVAAPGVSLT